MNRRQFLRNVSTGAALGLMPRAYGQATASRPNILVITFEDISPRLGCYGDPLAKTPTLDRLASEGTRYTNAYASAPVCAPARCSLITGVFAISLGGQNMRCSLRLPKEVKCFTEYLRQAGYYCCNRSKQDYQFRAPKSAWDESGKKAHWRRRPDKSQPFFAVFNIVDTHQGHVQNRRGYMRAGGKLSDQHRVDPAKVRVPAFLPDTPAARRDIGRIYDNIRWADRKVNGLLKALEEDGLTDNTIVIFYSDHGDGGIPRAKEYVYDSGIRVPMIIRAPPGVSVPDFLAPGSADDRLVSFVDLPPTILSLVGLPVPNYMQGRPFLGKRAGSPRQYVHAHRDRGNTRYDIMRAVRDKRFLYIRHYMPYRPVLQKIRGFENSDVMKDIRALHAKGMLSPEVLQSVRVARPPEELFDTQEDPDNVRNLAGDPTYRDDLLRLRAEHARFVRDTGDLGFLPEGMMLELRKTAGTEWDVSKGRGAGYDAVEAAHWAGLGQLSPWDPDEALRGLRSKRAVVLYWAAIAVAVHALNEADRDKTRDALRPLLASAFGDVRVAGALALLKHDLDSERARETFTEILSGNKWFVIVNAINWLDSLPDEEASLFVPQYERLRAIKYRSIAQPQRYANEIAGDMLRRLQPSDVE